MANKKVCAYAKDRKNEYVRKSNGELELFFIWDALIMRKNDTFNYEKISFFSTHSDEQQRKKMTTDIRGFYKYIENVGGTGVSGDGESLSHSVAIVALSELKSMNFTLGNEKHQFKFEKIQREDVVIRFENKNYYYPDLVGFFSKPDFLVEKWGGKVAIEVKVTHGCEDIKIRDFEDHNIPIIEITLNENMQFLKELRNEKFDENDLKAYYNFIKLKFSENVFGKVIANAVMPKYYALEKNTLGEKIRSYEDLLATFRADNEKLKLYANSIQRQNEQLRSAINQKTDNLINIENEIKELKGASFIQKSL